MVLQVSSSNTGTPDSLVMHFLRNGNVGIGVVNPAEKLHVNGNIGQSGVTSAMVKADSNGVLTAAVDGTDYITGNIYSVSGNITGNRTVGTQSYNISFSTNTGVGIFSVSGQNSILLSSANLLNLSTDNTLKLSHSAATNDYLTLNSGGFTFNTNGQGVRYAADYSSGYVSRSLVDKGYVDSVVAGFSTLYTSNGTITGSRTVTMNSNSYLNITGGGASFFLSNVNPGTAGETSSVAFNADMIILGTNTGYAVPGAINIRKGGGGGNALLKTNLLGTTNRSFEFPNQSGTIALTSDIPTFTPVDWTFFAAIGSNSSTDAYQTPHNVVFIDQKTNSTVVSGTVSGNTTIPLNGPGWFKISILLSFSYDNTTSAGVLLPKCVLKNTLNSSNLLYFYPSVGIYAYSSSAVLAEYMIDTTATPTSLRITLENPGMGVDKVDLNGGYITITKIT